MNTDPTVLSPLSFISKGKKRPNAHALVWRMLEDTRVPGEIRLRVKKVVKGSRTDSAEAHAIGIEIFGNALGPRLTLIVRDTPTTFCVCSLQSLEMKKKKLYELLSSSSKVLGDFYAPSEDRKPPLLENLELVPALSELRSMLSTIDSMMSASRRMDQSITTLKEMYDRALSQQDSLRTLQAELLEKADTLHQRIANSFPD